MWEGPLLGQGALAVPAEGLMGQAAFPALECGCQSVKQS